MRVIYPLVQYGLLDLLDKALLDVVVSQRMCGHIKQQKVLLLSGEDAFFNQVFCQPFTDVPQLIMKLQGVPRLS